MALLEPGCSGPAAKAASTPDFLTCVPVPGDVDMQRCENSEVVCYVGAQGSISCKFK